MVVVGNMNSEMRLFLISTYILFSFSVSGQHQVQLYFKNKCDNSIHELEYGLLNLNNPEQYISSENRIANIDSAGSYFLDATFMWGDYMRGSVFHTLEITKSTIDTLKIPKIKFTSFGGNHNSDWNYYNCQNLCDGLEREYYENGKVALEGEFNKGRPTYIFQYHENGSRETFKYYVVGKLQYKKIEHYSTNGELESYEVYKNGKRKTIVKTYAADGTQISREITKHIIERWK